jgi:hypothetical protein
MLTRDRLMCLRAELDEVQKRLARKHGLHDADAEERETEILAILREEGYAMRKDWFKPRELT